MLALMSERPEITLRDLAAIDVGQLRGVGEKKRASLAAFEIANVLDLLTTYPRRWVDRSNEARIADLVPGLENVSFIAGLSGHGFKMAPALARAGLDLAIHRSPSPHTDFLRLAGRPRF